MPKLNKSVSWLRMLGGVAIGLGLVALSWGVNRTDLVMALKDLNGWESSDMLNLVAFQLSSSFLTVALLTMIGETSAKTIYGTHVSEYLLERPALMNWRNLTQGLLLISSVSLVCVFVGLDTLIPVYTAIALIMLILLIKIISTLYFNNENVRRRIEKEYLEYMEGKLTKDENVSVGNDFRRLYFKTQEYLNGGLFDEVRDNLRIYVKMICHSMDRKSEMALKSNKTLKSLDYGHLQSTTKQLVMHLAFLIEECQKVNRNDLVIYACIDFLRSFFRVRAYNQESVNLLEETLGGYRRQILHNNFTKPFIFDFKVAHFLCQGVDGVVGKPCLESFKYVDQESGSKAVLITDYQGWTPLMEACEYGGLNIVRYLLEERATKEVKKHLTAVDVNKYTALDAAWENRRMGSTHNEICKLLLANGAKIKGARNKDAIKEWMKLDCPEVESPLN